jgi:hypothetical protein
VRSTREARIALATHVPHLKPENIVRLGSAYARDRRLRRQYRALSEAELLATRTSDTAFVFGSGRSILAITPEEWKRIAACNTISFSEFHRQRFVRADYHIVGEIADAGGVEEAGPAAREQGFVEYARLLRENPFYADTVLLLQQGWRARDSNELVARGLLRPGVRAFRYRRTKRGVYAPPSRSFRDGLVHGWNSSISSTNLALLLGFRRIVLAGVDMYDRGYFWLEEGERRATLPPESVAEDAFPTSGAVIDLFARWRALLEPEGVELAVYNPRSLLAGTLEVFRW